MLLTSCFTTPQNSVTTAFAETDKTYVRKALPKGGYEPETYAFAEGVMFDPTAGDDSLNALTFPEIGASLAKALLLADYVPTPSPKETDLLILVHWGKTIPFVDPNSGIPNQMIIEGLQGNKFNGDFGQAMDAAYNHGIINNGFAMHKMSEEARIAANFINSRILGYHEVLEDSWKRSSWQNWFDVEQYRYALYDIESPRYFVILQAYDFQKLWKEKKKELLWTTRFSSRAYRWKFDEKLEPMAIAASRVIGSDSNRLIRSLRASRVIFGDLEYMNADG